MSAALYVFDEYKSEAAAQAQAARLKDRGAVVRPLKSRGTWNVLVQNSKPDEAQILSFEAARDAVNDDDIAALEADMRQVKDDIQTQARQRIELLHGEKAARAFDAFRVIEAEEFASGTDAEPDWQIRGIIPRHGTGLHPGPSGTLKSFTELDIAAAINRGVPFHGLPVRKGRAVIVVAEGARGYKRRLRAYAKHHSVPLSDLPAIIPAAPNLFEPAQISALIARLDEHGATFVVLDTKWRCSVGADENSASDQAVVLGSMDRIARELGCFCMAVTHTGRDVSKGARGSSAQYAAVDTELTQERNGDYCRLRTSKQKDSESDIVLTFKAVPVDLGFNQHGEPESSLVLEPVDEATAAIDPTAKRSLGKLAAAVKEYIERSGETRFTKTALVSDASQALSKRASSVQRTIETQLVGWFLMEIPGADGEEYELRRGIVCDNEGWLK